MFTKSSLSYVGLALIPIVIVTLLVLVMPRGLDIGKYPWYVFVALGLFVLFIIINPLYLVILAKHNTIKHSVSYVLCVVVTVVSGFGSVLILNPDRWSKNKGVDFASEIMFTTELVIVGAILLVGMAIVAYLKFKTKT